MDWAALAGVTLGGIIPRRPFEPADAEAYTDVRQRLALADVAAERRLEQDEPLRNLDATVVRAIEERVQLADELVHDEGRSAGR